MRYGLIFQNKLPRKEEMPIGFPGTDWRSVGQKAYHERTLNKNYGDDKEENNEMFDDMVFGDDFLCPSPPAENPFGKLKRSMFRNSNDEDRKRRRGLLDVSFEEHFTNIDNYV